MVIVTQCVILVRYFEKRITWSSLNMKYHRMTEIYLEMISFIFKKNPTFSASFIIKMEILQSLLTSLKPAVVYFSHNKNYIYHLPSNVIFGRGYMHFFIMSKFYNARCLWLTCSWMSTQTRNNCKCIKQILLIRNWKYWWTVFTGCEIKVLGW